MLRPPRRSAAITPTPPSESDRRPDSPWERVNVLARMLADGDLRRCCDTIHPRLFAFEGRELLVVVELRPFPRGGYRQPLREALNVVVPLGADRLVLSIGGRAWSLDDPIPPVTADVDLRQRVLVVHTADGHRRELPAAASTIHPWVPGDDGPEWEAGTPMPGPGDGWLTDTLLNAVRRVPRKRARRRATPALLRSRMERCLELGHEFDVGLVGGARLLADRDPDLASTAEDVVAAVNR